MGEQPQSALISPWKSFVSGGVAGVISKTMIAPIERVKYLFLVLMDRDRKTRNRKFTYRLYLDDLRSIVRRHGVRNLWRGNLMNVARIFPHAAIVQRRPGRTSQCST